MLKDQISNDIKSSMKSGDKFTLEVLRGLSSAFGNKSIEKRGKGLAPDLTEEEVLEILNKEVKKRKDSVNLYNQGNRKDLADKEEKEIIVIQKYLPAQMSREEVEKIINEVIGRIEHKDFGLVMKEVMKELRGKADSQLISSIVKEKIS